MGSGLIWASLGKGIADAGTAFSSAMAKDIADKRQEERDALREERLLKRQEAADERQAQRKREEDEALKQRVAKESAQVETQAVQMGEGRRQKSLAADADKLAAMSQQAEASGDVALGRDQLLGLIESMPELRESYRKLGAIAGSPDAGRDPRMVRAEDRVTAAMETGAHSSVLEAYTKAKADTLKEIAEDNRQKKADAAQDATNRRLDQQDERLQQADKKNDALIKYLGQRGDAATRNADTAASRAASSPRGSVKDAPTERLTTQAETLRKAAKEATGDRKKNLEAELDQVLAELRRRRESGGASSAPRPAQGRAGSGARDYSNLWK
jgi:hypothetical protein